MNWVPLKSIKIEDFDKIRKRNDVDIMLEGIERMKKLNN
jgi:molybdenum cofactor biosynthesis enzyme MoaA